MKRSDETEIGGTHRAFLTTHWSLIDDIQASEGRDRALINLLLDRYWKPVYCYLRSKGYDNESAKDMTQGFFHEVVLNRHLAQRADRSKGRFRSFLLHALEWYLKCEWVKENACKRIPQDKLTPLDTASLIPLPDSVLRSEPDNTYNYAWVVCLLEDVLAEVKRDCCQAGLETHWQVFEERVVQPTVHSVSPPSLDEVCARYGISDADRASNMAITVKRRFQKALHARVRKTVVLEDQVEDELDQIMRFLSEAAQDMGSTE